MINLLPTYPTSKSGWPWTEESDALPPLQPDNTPWPRISIVTPSFNQGQFIEESIRSILLQNYPNLEYFVIDGGSTDNTPATLKKYEKWINYWVSEPDRGQSHAINKGFEKCSGVWVNWICSDDLLCKNAFTMLAPLLVKSHKALIIGSGFRINEKSQIINEIKSSDITNFSQLIDIKNYWRNGNPILQQGTLYPLNEIKKFGYLNEKNHFTMDYELWGKLLTSDIQVIKCQIPVGMFRWYPGQKTSKFKEVTNSLTKTAISLSCQHKNITLKERIKLISFVWRYRITFTYQNFRSFIGIKRRLKSLLFD